MKRKLCWMLLVQAAVACSDDALTPSGTLPGAAGGDVRMNVGSGGSSGDGTARNVNVDASGTPEPGASDAAEVPADGSQTAQDARGGGDDGKTSLVPSPDAGGWQLNELAKIVNGALELTPGVDNMDGHERGTAFWPMAIASEGLEIAFDAEIIPIPNRFHGDGMTLALADVAAGAKPTDFGDSGGGMGYTSAPCCGGIKGLAVALDTSKNANDPAPNFLGIATGGQIDRMTWAATKVEGVPTWAGSKHRIGVAITAGSLVVSIDGNEILRTAGDTPPIPKQVLVGFTAANGSNKSRHLVTNFAVSRR